MSPAMPSLISASAYFFHPWMSSQKMASQVATSLHPLTCELIHAKKNMSQLATYLRHILPLSPLTRPVYTVHKFDEATSPRQRSSVARRRGTPERVSIPAFRAPGMIVQVKPNMIFPKSWPTF
jgi:hypothetical protein